MHPNIILFVCYAWHQIISTEHVVSFRSIPRFEEMGLQPIWLQQIWYGQILFLNYNNKTIYPLTQVCIGTIACAKPTMTLRRHWDVFLRTLRTSAISALSAPCSFPWPSPSCPRKSGPSLRKITNTWNPTWKRSSERGRSSRIGTRITKFYSVLYCSFLN